MSGKKIKGLTLLYTPRKLTDQANNPPTSMQVIREKGTQEVSTLFPEQKILE